MFEVPETRYAKSGNVNIAYQVVGDGPFDLIHVPPFVSNLDCSGRIRTSAGTSSVSHRFLV